MTETLRETVWRANRALPDGGLVRWTSGNASARDPVTGLVAIKPSGMSFAEMTVDDIVVVDAEGRVVEGNRRPSVDTASHLHVYRHRADIHGIVHTHSCFATALAIRGEEIPVVTTTAAAIFGVAIPISNFATIGEIEIGQEIVARIGQAPAILMRNHGVFALGATVSEALKNAIYVEETAESYYYARLLGSPIAVLDDAAIADARRMYLTDYGQSGSRVGAKAGP